jgi:hypothetical protein
MGSGSVTVEEVLLTIYSLGEPWKCKKEGDGAPGAPPRRRTASLASRLPPPYSPLHGNA